MRCTDGSFRAAGHALRERFDRLRGVLQRQKCVGRRQLRRGVIRIMRQDAAVKFDRGLGLLQRDLDIAEVQQPSRMAGAQPDGSL